MFCMIHMNVNIFLMHAPLVRKRCKGFDGCLVFCLRYYLE